MAVACVAQLWLVGASVSDDGATLLISLRNGCEPTNRLFYLDLGASFDAWLAADAAAAPPLRIVRIIDYFGT